MATASSTVETAATTSARPVVVGIDGTPANEAALAYAAAEAQLFDAPLKVVHVVPDRVTISPWWWPLDSDLPSEPAKRLVQDAETEVRRLAPEVDVMGWVHHGPRAAQLAQSAEHALELVVGRDDHPLVERLVRGDTATGVAARAVVPVVQVPADWSADAPRHGAVVVGIKTPEHARPLLEDGFAVASRRQATLVVVHAWRLPSGYDDVVESPEMAEQWRLEATGELDQVLRPWQERYPEVKVEVRVVHDHPGPALVEASRTADLLLVARREHGVPAALHLGGTARTALRAAACPVRVVPPGRED